MDHGTPPAGREDTAWVFDVKTCSLLIFGGWANRWLGDTLKLNVSPIIGPPYACIGISPEEGPVFGSSDLIIKGLRFREGKIQVRMRNPPLTLQCDFHKLEDTLGHLRGCGAADASSLLAGVHHSVA